MKRTILLLLVLFLVATVAFAAPVSVGGKIQAQGNVSFGGAGFGSGEITEQEDIEDLQSSTTASVIEADLKVVADDFNNATIQLRAETGGTASTAIIFGDVFLESNIAGALGWTSMMASETGTEGLILSAKTGFFNPGPSERGESKTIVEEFDAVDGDPAVTGPALLATVGWGGLSAEGTDASGSINLAAGLRFPGTNDVEDVPVLDADGMPVLDDNDMPTNTQRVNTNLNWHLNLYGDVALGLGSFGYATHFLDYAGADRQEIGIGLEWKNILLSRGTITAVSGQMGSETDPEDALGMIEREVDIATLGFGTQFAYNLQAATDANTVGLGASVGLGFIDDSIELDIDWTGSFGGATALPLDKLGVGFRLQTINKVFGLTTKFFLDENVPENETAAQVDINLEPSVWFKAGATTFTIGTALNKLNDSDAFEDASNIFFIAELGY